MEKQKSPELRFSQFKNDWNETKLGDVVDIVGGGTPDTNVPEFWNGDIDWYSPTEIGENVYVNGSIKKITAAGLKNSSAKILPAKKTVLFSSRAGIGDMAILDKPAATNQGFQSFIANNIDVYFLYSMGVKIKKFALSKASGSTFLEISRNQLAQMEFLAPSIDSKEQTQIGHFFQNLDQSIALQEKKLSQTQNLKKAMLEKMFPQIGNKRPEIRLKGFIGDWVESKLGDVYSFNYGKFNTNPSNGGQYPVYGANGIIGGYTDYNAESSAVIGHMGEYAGSVLWAEGKHFVTYNGTISKPKKSDFDSLFGYFMLVKMNLKKVCGGSGQPFLSYEVLERLNVLLPTLEEQTVIGQFFKQLDETLVLQQQQLQTLKNLKQAFWEKMFV